MVAWPEDEELPMRCACGKVTAVAHQVRPQNVNHVICGCRYCRAYARHLGRADDMLDKFGGTEVFQMSPRDLKFTSGAEYIACLRITRKGPLRWYTDCCKTPIANTFETPAVPFMGVAAAFVDRRAIYGELQDFIGPVAVRVNTRRRAPGKGVLRLVAMVLRFSIMIAKWRLSGDHKHSPFFDALTGEPHRRPEMALFSAQDMKANGKKKKSRQGGAV